MPHASCQFDLASTTQVLNLLLDELGNARPFSMVRLGDGEGLLLSITEHSPERDLHYLQQHLGPAAGSLDYLLALRDRMLDAVRGASLIGIRDDVVGVEFPAGNLDLDKDVFLEQFRARFRLREVERELAYAGARRLALLHRCLCELDLAPVKGFCSAWVQYDLQLTGGLLEILRRSRSIGLITSRVRLADRLRAQLGCQVRQFALPGMYRDLDEPPDPDAYIAGLESILDQRLVDYPGMLYLVGAGLYGKLYCERIRSQGGLALDVGSLLDAWAGIPSRPAVLQTLFSGFKDGDSVPGELQLPGPGRRMGRMRE